ncbi:TetR/AcrR family transcriptional regulator [Streptomyces bottropensis]|uniref:TetR/AcrR family transcriptional regulator n=1 Tax=Streptomyces bottropensis TaxID=42235 RepID=UPI0037B7000F
MRGPVQRRSEDSTVRMLDAALELAAGDGLGAVTIAAVAEGASTSNGSVYHRFGSRAGLLVAMIDRFLGRVESELRGELADATAEPDDVVALEMLIGAHMRIFERESALFWAFMVEGRNDPALRERGFQASGILSTEIASWLRTRFSCDPGHADTVFRILFGLGVTRVMFGDSELTANSSTPDEQVKMARDIVMGQLVRAQASRPPSRHPRRSPPST